MVTTRPKRLARDARCVFNEPDLPSTFDFYERLSPLHQRLFVVDLWQALSRFSIEGDEQVSIEGDEQAANDLLEMVDGWEATADVDANPEVAETLARPTVYRPLKVPS